MNSCSNNSTSSRDFDCVVGSGVSSLALTAAATSQDQNAFRCAKIFEAIQQELATEGEQIVKRVKGVFAFSVTGGGGGGGVGDSTGLWIVDCKNGRGSVEFNGKGKPDVTITISDQNLVDLMLGKLNAQQAFLSGKFKLQGNLALGMRLKEFQNRLAGLQGKL